MQSLFQWLLQPSHDQATQRRVSLSACILLRAACPAQQANNTGSRPAYLQSTTLEKKMKTITGKFNFASLM